MTADTLSYLVLSIVAMHITFFAISGIILINKNHEQRDRSRLIFGIACLSWAMGATAFISNAILLRNPVEFLRSMLSPYPSIIAMPFFLLLPTYVLEVLRPNWFTFGRVFHFLSPWIITCMAFLVWHGMQGWEQAAITPLTTWNEVTMAIDQPNVILRLILAAFFIIYGLITCFIPFDRLRSNATSSWKWVLQVLVVLIAVSFVVGVLLRVTGVMMLYLALVDTMIGLVLYMELRVRIPVPEQPQPAVTFVPTALETSSSLSKLAQDLQALLDSGVWQDSEICRESLCKELGTNRTYLYNAIHELGYESFADMINIRRMEYIEQQLKNDPSTVISDLLFQAGYRNRSSAIRSFTLHFGVSPTKFSVEKC